MIKVLFYPALLAALCGGKLTAETALPNILFAIADDWGLHAEAYGTRWVKTPAFDRIAREGLLFQNAYTPVAKCAPSRACVLTGRQPIMESTQSGRVVPERDHVLIGKKRNDVGRPHNWGYPIRGIVTAEFLYLHNYEPTRWPAGNPETGYLDTDGSPTKSLILDLGRANRADRFWQINFGMRPGVELYDLRSDRDCVRNLAADLSQTKRITALRGRMETMLKAQQDPRMEGRGEVFDRYKPTEGDGLYEKYLGGKKVETGWVNPTDFEEQTVKP